MKMFKILKVQLSGIVLDQVQHNMLCRICLNKCIVTISIYFLRPVLLEFFLLNLSYFDQKSTFLVGLKKKKKSVKCLSKFLFKDSYRIRTTGSHNCSLILFKYISSSLKKNNQRKWIFWHTH